MSRRSKIDRDVLETRYREAAESAAAVERLGNYAQAAELWTAAEKVAVNLAQAEWCKTRRLYCKIWQNKRAKKQ